MNLTPELTQEQIDEIEKKYDTSLNTRDYGPTLRPVIYWATVAFALYHIWTAGFGTPVDYVHMGVHLAGLFFFLPSVGAALFLPEATITSSPKPAAIHVHGPDPDRSGSAGGGAPPAG